MGKLKRAITYPDTIRDMICRDIYHHHTHGQPEQAREEIHRAVVSNVTSRVREVFRESLDLQ